MGAFGALLTFQGIAPPTDDLYDLYGLFPLQFHDLDLSGQIDS